MRLVTFISVLGYFIGFASTNFLECQTQSDCLAEEATCTNNLCQCPIGMTHSVDGTKCLQLVLRYEDPCTDDAQCAPLLGKNYCKSQTCQCQTGYRYYKGMCIPSVGYGKSCTKDEDCFVSPDLFAMVCSDSKCTCGEGYYSRGEFDCRPLAKELNDPCGLDSDCKLIPDSICNNGCVLKDVDPAENVVSVTKDATRYVNDNTTLFATTRDAQDCDTNEDCVEDHTYCSPLTKTCVCQRGYYYNTKNECVAELGIHECVENSDCPNSPKTCKNGLCVCPTTHYYGLGLNKCVKAGYKVNNRIKCNTDLACNVMGPLAECVEENFDSFCECKFGTELNEDYICVQTEECVVGCMDDEECEIVNSICKKGECVCPDNYRLEGDKCLPNLGSTCDTEDRECTLENSECGTESKCSCTEGYVQLDSTTCAKEVGLHEECVDSLQCIWGNTECKKGTCQCKADYPQTGDLCIKSRAMGEYCTNLLQCQVGLGENVLCRNSKCQCAAGSVPTADMLDCVPRSPGVSVHRHSGSILLSTMLFVYYIFRE